MERIGIIALMVAIGSGIAIGVQATLNNWSGRIAGPITTGLFVNFAGGIICGIILLVLLLTQHTLPVASLWEARWFIVVAGAIGIAYALPRIGIAAGLAAVILGQLLVATVVDSFGWGGAHAIPLSASRVAGLVLLLLAVRNRAERVLVNQFAFGKSPSSRKSRPRSKISGTREICILHAGSCK